MTEPITATPANRGLPNPLAADGLRILQTGLDLTRASQLTMLRFQLALHKSNQRTAMQALDDLLDIDTEIEGLAATLGGARPADAAALAGFIGQQKAALAMEKHGLTGGEGRKAAGLVVEPAAGRPDDEPAPPHEAVAHSESVAADLPVEPAAADHDGEGEAGRRWWVYALAVALVVIAVSACLWPDLRITVREGAMQIQAIVAGWLA